MVTRLRALKFIRDHREQFRRVLASLVGDASSRAEMRRGIEAIVEVLVASLPYQEFASAPRRSDVIRWVKDSARLSRQLRQALLRGGDWYPTYRRALINDRDADAELTRLYGEAGIRYASDEPKRNGSSLYSGLLAFESFREAANKHIPHDKGGATNLELALMGSPRWFLVLESARMFARLRPNDVTGSEGGALYEFCSRVFEMVTGTDVEVVGSGIRRHVTLAAPLVRRLGALDAKERDLLKRASTEDLKREFEALWRERREIDEQLHHGPPRC